MHERPDRRRRNFGEPRTSKQHSVAGAAHGKNAPSGSLMASMDDQGVIRKRSALAKRIADKLTAVEPSSALVGFAYAVNSRVKGVRWFSSNALFKTFREVLVN